MKSEKENKPKELDYRDKLWEMSFFELKKFKEKFGHCDVSLSRVNNKYYLLGKWCNTQRTKKKFEPLKYDPERERRLNEIGFSWTILDKRFEEKFIQLLEFKKEYGHCDIPGGSKKYHDLATWAQSQRRFRNGEAAHYDAERERRFNEIGFSWNILDKKFEKGFKQLVEFKKKYGHCDILLHDKEYPSLSKWVRTQRNHRNNLAVNYNPERERRLKEIGFSWSIQDKWFEDNFKQLAEFKRKYGHCDVPHSRKNNKYKALGQWCNAQRQAKVNQPPNYPPDRERRLNKIGFPWGKMQDKWFEKNFEQLVKFKNKYGHCNVSLANKEYLELAKWVQYQRRRKNILLALYDQERERRLNKIGFSWDPADETFEKRLAELADFKTQFGHFHVPLSGVGTLNTWITMPNGFRKHPKYSFATLTNWCNTQRAHKRNKTLERDRERRLSAIGFSWQPHKESFEKNFMELYDYYKVHGHCQVVGSENLKLANWCRTLRSIKKGTAKDKNLTPQRIKRLDALNFEWEVPVNRKRKYAFNNFWDNKFSELKEYKEKYGDFDVKELKNSSLHKWVSCQRRYYKNHERRLTTERIKMLNDIGFNWTTNYVWTAKKVTDDNLLDDLRRLHTLLNRKLGYKDIQEHGKYGNNTYKRHFGSLANACKLAGI